MRKQGEVVTGGAASGEGQEVHEGRCQGGELHEQVKREMKEQLQGKQLFAWL